MQEGLRRQEETLASRVPLSSTDWHNYEGHYLKFHRLDRKPVRPLRWSYRWATAAFDISYLPFACAIFGA